MEENTMRFYPVEIQTSSSSFSVVPGGSVTVPFRIINHTGNDAYFEISVRGIPTTWAIMDIPVIHLTDGEQRETSLTIQPPSGMAGSTGATRMVIRAASQAHPDQSGETSIDLHIGYDPHAETKGASRGVDPLISGYPAGGTTLGTLPAAAEASEEAQFDSDLSPRRIGAGSTARLRIYNLSSTPQLYTVSWSSPQGSLEFVSSESGPVRVMPGAVTAVDCSISPRSPNWIGGPVNLPYSVVVRNSQGEAQAHNGEVISRALIPVWVLPAFLVFCLTALCGVGFLWDWNQTRLAAATETADAVEAGLLGSAAATATAIYELTQVVILDPSEDPTHVWQTVTAIAMEVQLSTTPSPVPTDTMMPSETPLQTGTAQVIIITATPSNTPSPTLTFTATATSLPPTATFTLAPPTATPTQLVLPVTGAGQFAFVSDRDGSPQLYLLNVQEDTLVPLTEGLGAVSAPAWSPDGNKIAFTVAQEDDSDIYVMNSDGSDLVNLTDSAANDSQPAWSPDGAFIAFTSDRDGNGEIYIMGADGSEPTKLTEDPAFDRDPEWFERGGLLGSESRILFTTDRDGNDEIYAINVDGSDPVNLTDNPANDTQPAAQAGGNQVAFTSDRDGNQEIYAMTQVGGEQVNLTNNPANDSQPVWSPEGDWFAFVSDREGNADIFVMQVGQEQAEKVSQSQAQDLYPTWR